MPSRCSELMSLCSSKSIYPLAGIYKILNRSPSKQMCVVLLLVYLILVIVVYLTQRNNRILLWGHGATLRAAYELMSYNAKVDVLLVKEDTSIVPILHASKEEKSNLKKIHKVKYRNLYKRCSPCNSVLQCDRSMEHRGCYLYTPPEISANLEPMKVECVQDRCLIGKRDGKHCIEPFGLLLIVADDLKFIPNVSWNLYGRTMNVQRTTYPCVPTAACGIASDEYVISFHDGTKHTLEAINKSMDVVQLPGKTRFCGGVIDTKHIVISPWIMPVSLDPLRDSLALIYSANIR